mmetsp:Transcript_16438/g.38882  ORF Transcript_16438/g.38882 Transcript_16438/m.38882 type:complete len:936 (-) Transcript_16438:112-2919(-)
MAAADSEEKMADITTFEVTIGAPFASFEDFHSFEPHTWTKADLERLFAGIKQFVLDPTLFRWLNDPLLNCAPEDHPGRAAVGGQAEVLVWSDKLVSKCVDAVADDVGNTKERMGSMLAFLHRELVTHLTGPVAADLRRHREAGAVVVLERLAMHWGYFQKVVKLFANFIYRSLDLGIKLSSCENLLPRTSPVSFRCFTFLFREFGRGLVDPCIDLMNRKRDGAECDLTPVRNVADMLLCISLADLNNKADYTRFIKGSRRVVLRAGIAYFDEFHGPVLDAARAYFRRRAARQDTVTVPEAINEVFELLNREKTEIGAWVHNKTSLSMLRSAQAEMLVGQGCNLEPGCDIASEEAAVVCTRVCADMARLLQTTQTAAVQRIYLLYKGLPVDEYLRRVATAYETYIHGLGAVVVDELRKIEKPDKRAGAAWVDGMVNTAREAFRWVCTEADLGGAFCEGPPTAPEPHKLFKTAEQQAIQRLINYTNSRVETNKRLHTEGRAEKFLAEMLDKMLRSSSSEGVKRVTLDRATLAPGSTENYTLGDVLSGVVARVHTADSLMVWYQTKLAERILSDSVAHDDKEKEVLAWLKLNFANCEKEVAKCDTMRRDVYGDAARTLETNYNAAFEAAVGGSGAVGIGGGVIPPIDADLLGVPKSVTVKVLTQANWPTAAFVESQTKPRLTLGVPRGMESVMAHFTAWYATQGSSKKVQFYTSAGSVIFTVCPVGSSKQVFKGHVTTPQGVVMMLFNTKKNVTVRDVVNAFRLEEGDDEGSGGTWKVVQRVIHPLIVRQRTKGKGCPHFLTIKKGDGGKHSTRLGDIKLDDVLSVNMNRKKYFLLRSAYQPAAPALKPERQSLSIMEHTERMREVQLKAAMMRVVKARRHMQMNHLFPEVRAQLAGRFTPKIPQMKATMNVLIKDGYLRRSEDDHRVIELRNVSGAG